MDASVALDTHSSTVQAGVQPETTTEAHLIPLPESPSRCATPVSVMEPIHEFPDNNATVTSINTLSTDEADQVRPTETDATIPSEVKPAQSLTSAKENDGTNNQIDVLQELATDRMAVMGLRSGVQEQGKALSSVLEQCLQGLSSVVAVLEGHTHDQVSEQLNTISSLLSSAEGKSSIDLKSAC
ncbi:hypothetical protein ES702_02324 [subsurface metagenome]